VGYGITKWHQYKSLEFDGMDFFQHLKTNFSYKCYEDGQRMNINTLTIYIIYGPFGDIMLNHNLQLDVGCDFTNGTKAILIVNVDCNYFILAN